MLVWSTQFPILPNRTTDDLLTLCQKWFLESPNYSGWNDSDLPIPTDAEILTVSKNGHTIEVAKIEIDKGRYCGFRHQWRDKDRREWVTEICGWHTAQRFMVGVHLHCSTADTGIPLPQPKKPYIVRQILDEMGGDIDGAFLVDAKPRKLKETEIDVAVRLLRGEIDHSLPVIYASTTWQNTLAFDSEKLAQWSGGMAHVVTEPSRRFSFVLAAKINKNNPYGGAIAVCWPDGSGRTSRLFPYHYSNPVRFSTAIADLVCKALAGRRPNPCCTWDYLRELIAHNKIVNLQRDGKTGLEEYIKTFDEELTLTRKRLDEAENEIRRLKAENIRQIYKNNINSEGLLNSSSENELYAGEQRDILIHALKIAQNSVQPDGRVKDVIGAFLDANPPIGEGERIQEKIREILSNRTNVGESERRELEELGFLISEDGKHLKLVFCNDDRYTFAMPKTGSDWRGLKNWISDTNKRLFK